jgi:hypothetical protein
VHQLANVDVVAKRTIPVHEIELWSHAQNYILALVYNNHLLSEHSQQVTNLFSSSQDLFVPMEESFLVIFITLLLESKHKLLNMQWIFNFLKI